MKLRTLIVFFGVLLLQPLVFGQTSFTVAANPLNIQPGDAAKSPSQNLSTESLATAEELNSLASVALTQGDLARSEQYFHQALDIERKAAPGSLAMAKSLNGLGDIADKHGAVTKADEYYREAFSIAQRLDAEGVDVTRSLHGQGMAAYNRGNLAKAEEYFLQALAICQKRAPGGLEAAQSLDDLALVSFRRGRMSKAEELYQQALAIRENLAPGSLEVAISLNHLGSLAVFNSNVDKSEEYFRRAVAVQEHLPPNRLDHAMTLMGLSDLASGRSELSKAETYLRDALEIQEKLIPESLTVAKVLSRLSSIARLRGDLEKAEQFERRALSIRQKRIPDSLDLAVSFNSLGNIASRRGDLATAEEYQQKALKIRETLNPGSPELVLSFWSLGAIYARRGDERKAHEFYLKALAIAEKIDPDGPMVAACQSTLSSIALSEGDLIKAEDRQLHALGIQEKLTPGSGEVAQSLTQLGAIAERRGDAARAERYWRQALAIWEKMSPGSMEHTALLAALAKITRDTQQPEVSAQFYEQTLTALENQITRLGGGDEVRSDFRGHTGYYKDYINLLMGQQQTEQAFQVLERSRARALLELLTLAKVDVQHNIDPSLLKQQRSLRESLAAKTGARIQLLSHKHTEEQLAAIDKEIADLLAQGHQVEAQITADSPRYAALTRPQPLSATEVQQQLLDNDTLLLEYSLDEKRSYVFAVSAVSVAGYELPPRAEVEKAARRVYDLVTAQNSVLKNETEQQKKSRWMKAEAEYPKAAQALSEMVLGPLASKLERKRLLIVSDGALEYIPFAALPAPGFKATKMVPLVLEHEIVNLPSASVLAMLRQQATGRKPAPMAVAVLADPVFDKHDDRVALRRPGPYIAKTETGKKSLFLQPNRSWAVADGELHLPRLPFTRREAQAIMAVVPARERMQALDFQANRALATSPELGLYRIVHFATHGLLDSDHPELSGLVLSMVDEQGRPQNGFLELQDVYNLNLRAELVVLSSCETGLGKQINGEGLVGLTRGFMYAGASRVVASLWKVSDIATAKLMVSFYKALEQEKARPAAALRAAQIEMWRQARWKAPYFWAAFQIQGEWR